jgi:hypothetical protein
LKNKKEEEQSREILPSEQLSELPLQQLNPKSNKNPNFAAQNRSPQQQKLIKIKTLQEHNK